MAAPISEDRKLAAQVRRLALGKIKTILERPAVEMNDKDKQLHDAILIKLTGTLLPRLNELTGEDGGAVQVTLIKYANDGNNPSTPVPATPLPSTDLGIV